jgi:hypothetical protein
MTINGWRGNEVAEHLRAPRQVVQQHHRRAGGPGTASDTGPTTATGLGLLRERADLAVTVNPPVPTWPGRPAMAGPGHSRSRWLIFNFDYRPRPVLAQPAENPQLTLRLPGERDAGHERFVQRAPSARTRIRMPVPVAVGDLGQGGVENRVVFGGSVRPGVGGGSWDSAARSTNLAGKFRLDLCQGAGPADSRPGHVELARVPRRRRPPHRHPAAVESSMGRCRRGGTAAGRT